MVAHSWCWALLLLLLPLCHAEGSKPGLLELTAASFVPTLKQLPEDRWVLMEFYAHWCPACQHFQPEYEKVAAFLEQRGEQEPVISVARVDCADHGDICSKFKISGYPAMRLGLAADLATSSVDKLTGVQPASRKFGSVVAFLEKQLDIKLEGAADFTIGALVGLHDGPEREALAVGDQPQGTDAAADAAAGTIDDDDPEPDTSGGVLGQQANLIDVEGATIRSWEYLAASPLLLKGPDARQALKDWVDLLADSHPVERCRLGAEKVQDSLDELWPDEADTPAEFGLQGIQICPDSSFKDWSSCASEEADRRGYTCGLWQLFHTLAARLPDTENAGAVWLAAIKGFVGNYFQCSECAKHFIRHAGGEEAVAVARKRDAVLWMWKAHNIVNRRLGAEELADPTKQDRMAPHVQFPTAAMCSVCRKGEGQGANNEEAVPWDEDEVYKFLVDFYSGEAKKPLVAAAGSRHAGWVDAGAVVGVVAGCVYVALKKSGQYSLRKSMSRVL